MHASPRDLPFGMKKREEGTAFDVVIVGSGASGTLVAANLRRRCSPARIAIVERSGSFYRGIAYSTRSPHHLLNVRAGRMSAFASEPDHFLDWLRARTAGAADAAEAFVPRALYGSYLQSLIDPSIVPILGEVDRIEPVEGGCRLALTDGGVLEARFAVLALGNRQPSNLPVPDGGLYSSDRYRGSLWVDPRLAELHAGEEVLILGTGLSMVDTVLSLLDAGHEGTIHLISRHGLLPLSHGTHPPRPLQLPLSPTLRELIRRLRAAAAERIAAGAGWEEVVDALRPDAARQWALFSLADRRRFLRHARAHWDVHRHRIAPQIGRRLRELQEVGRLRIHAGRVRGFAPGPAGVEVRFQPRGQRTVEKLVVDQVFNCTGPGAPAAAKEPLLQDLLARGLARLDPQGLGLETDGQGALVDGGGRPSTRLFTLGPLRLGELWETVAIPEIRVQAAALAERIVDALAAREGSRGT